MSNAIDRVAIELKQNREVHDKCYPPLSDLFKMIVTNISGDARGTFGDVVISTITPETGSENKLWIATDPQRTSFDMRLFINGAWRPWYFLAPSQVVIIDGRAPVPAGFQELGRFKSADIPIIDTSGSALLPEEFIIVRWIGY